MAQQEQQILKKQSKKRSSYEQKMKMHTKINNIKKTHTHLSINNDYCSSKFLLGS